MSSEYGGNSDNEPGVCGNGFARPAARHGSSSERPRVDQPRLQTKGRRIGRVEIELARNEIAIHAVPRAHRRAAIAEWIPGETDTRLDVGPLRIHPGVPGKSWIA